jgi:hypothetical protein
MKTVVALYDQIADANAAVRDLVDFGIARDNISLMASDSSGNYGTYFSGQRTSAGVEEGVESTASGAATGAGIGAIVGGLGGLLVGLGVLAVPGIGPVLAAGPLATAISAITGAGVGAMAGGAAGGLIGALVDLGLPEETAGNYAEGVRRGGTLVTVRTEDHQAEEARRIMNRHNVVNLDERVRGWRDQGWTGYNANQDVREMRSDNATSDVRSGLGMSDVNDRSGVEASPYVQDTDTEHARHPDGGMYGGLNAPDEDGERNRSAFTSSEHSGYTTEGSHLSGSTTGDSGVSGYNDVRSGSQRFDWENDQRYRAYDQGFQTHYTTTYGNRGRDYEYYRPAYYYGYQLAGDERYRGWNWNDLEPDARREWESRGQQGAWEDFKDAVQHSWNRVKEGVRETFD